MAQIVLTHTFAPNTIIKSSEMNTNLATDITATYNAHDTATNSVHGLGSANFVGDTTIQTLTNKTLTTPTINGATVSGTFTGPLTFADIITFSDDVYVSADNEVFLDGGTDKSIRHATTSPATIVLKIVSDLFSFSALGDFVIPASGKLRLDNSTSGDTYITERSANVIDLVAGGSAGFTVKGNGGFVATNDKLGLNESAETTYAINDSGTDYAMFAGNTEFLRGKSTGEIQLPDTVNPTALNDTSNRSLNKGWVTATLSGGVWVLDEQFGVTSVTNVSTTVFDVSWDHAVASSNMPVLTGNNSTSYTTTANNTSTTVTRVTLSSAAINGDKVFCMRLGA